MQVQRDNGAHALENALFWWVVAWCRVAGSSPFQNHRGEWKFM